MAEPVAVVKGTLDLLVLKALSGSPMHGFEVTCWLEERSAGGLAFDDSAVYHALYRMEKRGLTAATWGVTENNRKARYYGITTLGEEHLRTETARLLRYAEMVAGMLTAAPETV